MRSGLLRDCSSFFFSAGCEAAPDVRPALMERSSFLPLTRCISYPPGLIEGTQPCASWAGLGVNAEEVLRQRVNGRILARPPCSRSFWLSDCSLVSSGFFARDLASRLSAILAAPLHLGGAFRSRYHALLHPDLLQGAHGALRLDGGRSCVTLKFEWRAGRPRAASSGATLQFLIARNER